MVEIRFLDVKKLEISYNKISLKNGGIDMKFYTAKERLYGVFIWGTILILTIGLFLILCGEEEVQILPMALLLILIGFMISIWFGTSYQLMEDHILVRFGWLRDKIAYKDITNLSKSRSPLSSYALSRDRIAIYTHGRIKAYISPRDKENFLHELSKHLELSTYDLD